MENIFYFCNPKSREMEAQENSFKNISKRLSSNEKNFKKVLVVWKKIFTFALANQGQQWQIKNPEDAERTQFIDITYNNQIKKTKASILNWVWV